MSFGRWLQIGLFLAAPAWSAEPPPEFTLEGVGGAGAILTPGGIVTIYGQHLGAAGQCMPPPRIGSAPAYPVEICATQVYVGNEPAGLLYVSEKQINFQVPKDGPENGSADLRVVHNGQWSKPLTMLAGFPKMTIGLDQPAYTDMPVWLKVEFRSELWGGIRYPSLLGPAGFGCNQVEVRRDGKLLERLPGSLWNRGQMNFSGPPCGGYGPPTPRGFENRLPLHLLYSFDKPGAYEVRFTAWDMPFDVAASKIVVQSEWTPIEVLPANHYQRGQWLEDVRSRHPMDAADLLSDVLPSLLGLPDEASLEIVRSFLHHPDENVRRFAENGLYYWPEESQADGLRH
jgi:hypothetical protein